MNKFVKLLLMLLMLTVLLGGGFALSQLVVAVFPYPLSLFIAGLSGFAWGTSVASLFAKLI